MIGLLLFELLRIVYFREFLILRANFDEIEKIKKTDLLYDCAYLLSKFGQNRSSRYRDIAGTKTLRTDVRTYVLTHRTMHWRVARPCYVVSFIIG